MYKFKMLAFQSDDYQKTLSLRNQVLRKPLGINLSDKDTQGEEEQFHFGVFEAEALVGCVVFKLISKTSLKLRQMAIHPSQQGKGLGSRLIAFTEAEIKNLGFSEIVMHARVSAISFYQKLGYEVMGEVFLEQGIEHVMMHKSIFV